MWKQSWVCAAAAPLLVHVAGRETSSEHNGAGVSSGHCESSHEHDRPGTGPRLSPHSLSPSASWCRFEASLYESVCVCVCLYVCMCICVLCLQRLKSTRYLCNTYQCHTHTMQKTNFNNWCYYSNEGLIKSKINWFTGIILLWETPFS